MEISTIHEDELSIILINGDLDASSSILLDQAIEEAVFKRRRKILVDCTRLNYISSAGLGVFMSHLQEFDNNQTSLVLFGLSDKVLNVFQLLGLDQLLTITVSEKEAKLTVNDSLL
jgi:anti-sigma B factor antagonist